MPWIIKRHSAGEHKLKVKRLKVRLVVQGQHMSIDKSDFTDVFSPVPHLSGVRCCMSMATAMKWKAVVDLTQGFIQASRRSYARIHLTHHPSRVAKGWKGHLYLPASRACRGARVVYQVLKPQYGMPYSGRCLHVTHDPLLLPLLLSHNVPLPRVP